MTGRVNNLNRLFSGRITFLMLVIKYDRQLKKCLCNFIYSLICSFVGNSSRIFCKFYHYIMLVVEYLSKGTNKIASQLAE